MRERLLANPEVKRLALILAVVAVILVLLELAAAGIMVTHFGRALNEKNLSAAGRLIAAHPELESEIIAAFTHEDSRTDITAGLEAASKYGYTVDMPFTIIPVVGGFKDNFLIFGIISALAGFFLFSAIFIHFLGGLYLKINTITQGATTIIEGDFTFTLAEAGEGAFSKLSHQFNRMSSCLENSLERLKGEKLFLKNIISDISHQLKTPLSSLKIFNELMLYGNIPKAQTEDFLTKSLQQLDRMEWLIVNLLKMARLEAGAVEYQKSKKPVYHALSKVVENMKPKAGLKRQKLVLEAAEENICLNYDSGWFQEAIENIIKNAIEHTPDEGEIRVVLMESPVMVRLEISDNGGGIHEEDLPHIFERFYKGRNNLNGCGTGIGLALAKAILEGHEGIITVRSIRGAGTRFTVTFPRM